MDIYLILLYLSIILLVGFLFGKLVEQFKLPDVTGYIIAGVLIGPYVFNLVDIDALPYFDVITSIVLGIIAYQIGTELFIPIIRKNAVTVVMVTIVHALLTLTLVFFGIWLLSGQLWLAFALSGMAIASAPAPVMQVIKRLKAKGPVKRTVIPVVGLLDIVAVIIFALFASIATSLVDGSQISAYNAILFPLYEVVLSIIVGVILGAILGIASKYGIEKLPKQERYLIYLVMILSFILSSIWIAERYHLSLILIPLSFGMTFTNMVGKETFMIQNAALSNFGGPFIVLFFTIAGLALSPLIMIQAGLLAVAFIGLRWIGKVVGSRLGASMTKCPATVKKYTGWCLLPQAGVTIGMLVALSAMLPPEETQLIQAITLSSILIFQIIGPIFLQRALTKAGEAQIRMVK